MRKKDFHFRCKFSFLVISLSVLLLEVVFCFNGKPIAYAGNFCVVPGPDKPNPDCPPERLLPEVFEAYRKVEAITIPPEPTVSDLLKGAMQHRTSRFFSSDVQEKRTPDRFLKQYNRHLESISEGTLPGQKEGALQAKETLSGIHQVDVIQAVVKQEEDKNSVLNRAGFNWKGYKIGVAISDMGKLSDYQELLTKPSPKSDLLLGVISGEVKSKSTQALKETLSEMGFPVSPSGKPLLLNAGGDIQNLRDMFESAPAMRGFLHALPGMADLIMAYEKGELNKEIFKSAVRANLFHNGPQAGYWKKMTDIFVPGAMAKSCQRGMLLLHGTPFFGQDKNNPGALSYPTTTSFEGAMHTFFDRISQASRGGLLKIYEEISFLPPVARVQDLMGQNNAGTIEQLQKLKADLSHSSHLTQSQKNIISDLTDRGIERLKTLQNYLVNHIRLEESVGPDGKKVLLGCKFTVDGKEISVPANGTDAKQVYALYEKVLLAEEAANGGDPMKSLPFPNPEGNKIQTKKR